MKEYKVRYRAKDNAYMIDYEMPEMFGNGVNVHRYVGTIEQINEIANKCDEVGYKIVNVQAVI